MKVAVTEVCADAIEDVRRPDHLRIAMRSRVDALEVTVSSQPAGIEAEVPDPAPPALQIGPLERRLREPLVHALFPGADYEPREHSLRLSLPWELPEELEAP